MMETKQKYFSPECEVVQIRMEAAMLISKSDTFSGEGEDW